MPEFSIENPEYLQSQLITYIGNKRALLPFIGSGVQLVQHQLGKEKLNCLDIFSGSGIVSRFLKQFSSSLTVNDLEEYACIISRCYLANLTDSEKQNLQKTYLTLKEKIEAQMQKLEEQRNAGTYKAPGFISELYSPQNMENIQKSDRCFYTPYNANYLDIARQLIAAEIPASQQDFFVASLLSQASIHANTAGIFKGFYKNSKTGTGQFGGNGKNALSRITGKIELQFPVFSNFNCPFRVFNQNANDLVLSDSLYESGEFDLAYFDPPYNQHPYGSNYFMLNLLAEYQRPEEDKISRVSGIPKNWNRSLYNKKARISEEFYQLVKNVRSKFVLISFNNEGFISREEMVKLLQGCGKVQVLEQEYNAFRGSRNLKGREIHVKEYLFLVDKR